MPKGFRVFLDLILFAIALAALSGVPGLCLGRTGVAGERVAVAGMTAAAAAGLAGALAGLCANGAEGSFFPWPAAGGGQVGLDPLSAFFLVPVFLMGALGPVYGLGYWPQRRDRKSTRLNSSHT